MRQNGWLIARRRKPCRVQSLTCCCRHSSNYGFRLFWFQTIRDSFLALGGGQGFQVELLYSRAPSMFLYVGALGPLGRHVLICRSYTEPWGECLSEASLRATTSTQIRLLLARIEQAAETTAANMTGDAEGSWLERLCRPMGRILVQGYNLDPPPTCSEEMLGYCELGKACTQLPIQPPRQCILWWQPLTVQVASCVGSANDIIDLVMPLLEP